VVWVKFIICLAAIAFAGTKLTLYGDAIAEKTRLGRLWIGLVLIAGVTTMPELVTSISSVALVRSPDLALGTILGSCAFNLAILALLDVLHSGKPVLSVASRRHIAAALWGILLIAIVAVGIVAGDRMQPIASSPVGIPSVAVAVLFLLGMWWAFRRERNHQMDAGPDIALRYEKLSGKAVYARFALAALVVIAAGIWLSFIGDEISQTTGWGNTFVGNLFLAITTSAPELMVAISAVRIGAIDLTVGDVLGANLIDIAIIFPLDLVDGRGSILSLVSQSHVIVASVAIVMSLLVVVGLRFQQQRKVLKVASWYAPALVALYVVGSYVLFRNVAGL